MTRTPIPLRPDRDAAAREWRTAFVQRAAIKALIEINSAKKIAMIAGSRTIFKMRRGAKAIAHTIEVMIGRGLDAKVFSADAPSVAPPDLLGNVVPIWAGASMADDLSGLGAKMTESGISAESIVFVAAPSQATKIKLVAGPLFNHRVIGANNRGG